MSQDEPDRAKELALDGLVQTLGNNVAAMIAFSPLVRGTTFALVLFNESLGDSRVSSDVAPKRLGQMLRELSALVEERAAKGGPYAEEHEPGKEN